MKTQNDRDLLLCDNCDKAYHMKCLKLKKQPEVVEWPWSDLQGRWYCTKCIEECEKGYKE